MPTAQTNAANDSQATAMMEQWLLNPDHFCIAPEGDFAGNKDTCYVGSHTVNRRTLGSSPPWALHSESSPTEVRCVRSGDSLPSRPRIQRTRLSATVRPCSLICRWKPCASLLRLAMTDDRWLCGAWQTNR